MDMDKAFVAECFGKAIGTYDKSAVVQKEMAAALSALMRRAGFPAGAAVYEAGAGTGLMTARLAGEFAPRRIVANDLCWGCAGPLSRCTGGRAEFVCGDAEALPVPEGADAVVSCAALQWFADKAAFIRKVSDALPEGGFFAFSTFGPGNLREVRELGRIGLEYDSADRYRAMISAAGLRLLAEGGGEERIFFPDARALLRHFRETGVGGVRHDKWSVRETMRFCRAYARRHGGARGLALTYHPLHFVCVR